MPRRKILNDAQRSILLRIPAEASQMSKYYLLSKMDKSAINQKRELHNKMGFALLICCIRYPGFVTAPQFGTVWADGQELTVLELISEYGPNFYLDASLCIFKIGFS
jgi:hypothetical protein